MTVAGTAETIGEVYDEIVKDTDRLIPDVQNYQNGPDFDQEAIYRRDTSTPYPVVRVVSGCVNQGNWPATNTSSIVETHFGFCDSGISGTKTRSGFDMLRIMRFYASNVEGIRAQDQIGTALTSTLLTPDNLNLRTPLAMHQFVSGGPLSGWESPGFFPQRGAPLEYREVRDLSPDFVLDGVTPEAIVAGSILNQLRTRVDVLEPLLAGENPRDVMNEVGWEYPDRYLQGN